MIDILTTSPGVRGVGLALVHFIWQGTLIALTVAVALHLFRRSAPQVRYLIGCVALGAMIAAPVITTLRLKPNAGEHVGLTRRVDVGPSLELSSDLQTPTELRAAQAPSTAATSPSWSMAPLDAVLPIIVVLWIFGVVALTTHLAACWLAVQRFRGRAEAVAAQLDGRVSVLCRRLHIDRTVGVRQSSDIDVPTLTGWLRPVVLMPASALTGLSASQIDAILAHELAHVRRHDYPVNLLQSLVETLLFYHPAVWWVSRRVRAERELCCDDVAVEVCGDRLGYARALASLEEWRGQSAAVSLAASDGDLVTRIRRILGVPLAATPRSSAWGILVLLVVTVPLMALGEGEVVTGSQSDIALPLSASVIANDVSRAVAAPAVMQTDTGSVASTRDPIAAQLVAMANASVDQAAVLQAEEQFRVAKVKADLDALDRLMDASIVSTNQNGNTRDKSGLLELWSYFRIQLLTLDSADVKITGDLATVTGRQTELNATGTDRMLFTRIWRRSGDAWKLISVTQFRDPDARPVAVAPSSAIRIHSVGVTYELFKNGALLGRPDVMLTTSQPTVVPVPDGTSVTMSLIDVQGSTTGVTVHARSASGVQAPLVPKAELDGTTPREFSWTFGADSYRLRLWRSSPETVPAIQVRPGGIANVPSGPGTN
jgi:beta-lactamase regulating signal transducer with metallopeptidase domain